ncbi:hypothetical protein LEN26_005326 [Aphanomyces euteiches]|nr:hypothetical protein LEN26_005326 [Aphanomyces euteiches]
MKTKSFRSKQSREYIDIPAPPPKTCYTNHHDIPAPKPTTPLTPYVLGRNIARDVHALTDEKSPGVRSYLAPTSEEPSSRLGDVSENHSLYRQEVYEEVDNLIRLGDVSESSIPDYGRETPQIRLGEVSENPKQDEDEKALLDEASPTLPSSPSLEDNPALALASGVVTPLTNDQSTELSSDPIPRDVPDVTHDVVTFSSGSTLSSARAVFTPRQIEAIISDDFQGVTEVVSLDVEDRMHPIDQSDLQRQIHDIRARRKTSQDAFLPLMESVLGRRITAADLHLLKSPAQLDDPQHWLDWFTTTLNSCEEARRASRDFSTQAPVASITRTARLQIKAQERAQRLRDIQLSLAHKAYHTAVTIHETSRLRTPPTSDTLPAITSRIRFSTNVIYHLVSLKITLKIPSIPLELTRRPRWPKDVSPHTLRTALIQAALPPLPKPPDPVAPVFLRIPDQTTKHLDPSFVCSLLPYAGVNNSSLEVFDIPHRRRRHEIFDQPTNARFVAQVEHSQSAPSTLVLVNKKPHLALNDTGAAVSILSETCWQQLGSPPLQPVESHLQSVEQRPLRVLGRSLFSVVVGGLPIEFPLWVMADTITDCIIGVDLLRRLRATINLATNHLCIPGTTGPISLSPLPSLPSSSPPPLTISSVQRTKIAPRTCCMLRCTFPATLPDDRTVLVEAIPNSLVAVARSLNIVHGSGVWVQVRNTGDTPLVCTPNEPIGRITLLPLDFEEIIPSSDPHEEPPANEDTQTPVTETRPHRLSHHVYPNHTASVQATRVQEELPINWEVLLQHDIFVTTSKAPGRTNLVKCYINTGSATPIKQAPYRVSQREGEIMEAEIKQYLELGLIRPSTSPWASPVLMIRKPDGSIRFCIDYRRLNEVTIKDSYPLPRIDDLLDVLGNAKYLSTMDGASGYWNVQMEEDSIPKTAFTCKFGLYEWLVMPFGLCNAVPQFERLMEHVLRDQL